MFLTAIIGLIVSFFNVLSAVLPNVSVLPFGIDPILVQGAGYLHYIMDIFPPLQAIFNGLLWIIGFKLTMMFIRIIPVIRHLFTKS